MIAGTKRFVLLDNRKAPVWQLRHNNVFVDDPDKGQRQIKYVKGVQTIYVDEMTEEERKRPRTPIDLVDGTRDVPENDPIQLKYMRSHPDFGKKYKLLDPESDAKEELAKIDLIDEAKAELKNMNSIERAAIAAILFGDLATRGWEDDRTRLELNKYIQKSDEYVSGGVSKPQYFLEVKNEPSTEAKFLVTQAIRQGVVKISTDKTSVLWAKDGGTIIPVASGENPVGKMAEFLLSDKGDTTLQELSKRVKKNK